MGKLPTLKPREVVALLEGLGFAEVRQKGARFRHVDGRGPTVPFHAGRDVSPTLLRKIAKDISLTLKQFLGLGDEAREQPDAGGQGAPS